MRSSDPSIDQAAPPPPKYRVAIDVGGTFIDFALLNEQTHEMVIEKQPARASTLVQELLSGLGRLPVPIHALGRVFHGTTVGINTVVQEQGARVGLITTLGFRDVLAIGRGRRPEVYNALYRPPDPLVPRHLRREVPERTAPDGSELIPLDMDALDRELDLLAAHRVDAIAICFLHSYANADHERQALERARERYPQICACASFQVATEWREFERTSTTVLNAYIQPLFSSYLAELQSGLQRHGFEDSVALMQSNGGVISASAAAVKPIRTLESGPAGGVIGAHALALELGFQHVICADVGGTTYDVALIEDGRILETTQTEVRGRPIIGPIIDIVSVGAGGGSIAWIDSTGAVQVGPRSAGALPGPACFGLGGTEPTVTDCHLILGRLDPERFLGSRMRLDVVAAERAIRERIAEPMGLSLVEAANGILAIAETNMTYAIRALTVERGLDPREFVLFSYGGGGGLFAPGTAADLEIETVLVPLAPANFSAVGILTSDYREDAALTRVQPFDQSSLVQICADLRLLARQAASELRNYGFHEDDIEVFYRAEIRYAGQDDTIGVPLEERWLTDAPALLDGGRERFVERHGRLYGHGRRDLPLEIVTSRCQAVGKVARPTWRELPAGLPSEPTDTRHVYFEEAGGFVATPVFDRSELARGQVVRGPAIVEEWTTTVMVPPGWVLTVDRLANLILTRQEIES